LKVRMLFWCSGGFCILAQWIFVYIFLVALFLSQRTYNTGI